MAIPLVLTGPNLLLTTITQSISQQELRERVYSGEILYFPKLAAIKDFCTRAQSLCESILNHNDPLVSHRNIECGDWLKQVFQYQSSARDDAACARYFAQALQSIGLNLSETFCDRFIFRTVPPRSPQSDGAHAHVDTHRDTWGAGIYQQINWWGPIYQYPESTGIEFFPWHFDQPIANTTARWSYEKYREARKQQSAELRPDYKSIPSLLEKPGGEVFRPMIQPGDLLCFSAAHLHGSSMNTTDRCRFSFETRTVNLQDIRSGLKASNVDNASDMQMLKLFNNLIDGSPLQALEDY